MFKRSITNRVHRDQNFEKMVSSFAATTEFSDIAWYPGQGKVVYKDDVRLPLNAPRKGKNDFEGFQPQLSVLFGAIRKLGPVLKNPNLKFSLHIHLLLPTEELLEATENADGRCLLAKVQVNALLATGAGLKNDESKLIDFTGYPVVGNQSDMQSSGSCLNDKDEDLLTACGRDSRLEGLFYHHTAFSIPIPQIPDFIADVKKLRELRPRSICGLDLYSRLLMRFVKKSTAFLGKKDDCVDFDMTYFRSRDPDNPRLDQDILEEMEQMAFFKYGALPHWGKNRPVAFIGAKEKYGDR